MANVLVVGGAGYIGSTTCAWLMRHGHFVTVLDDLSTGRAELLLTDRFVLSRKDDRPQLDKLLSSVPFDCVIDFAARCHISECFDHKDEYFANNVEQTKVLLQCLLDHGVKRFVFSSTCTVYGDPGLDPVDETTSLKPINPYAQTKVDIEHHLEELAREGLSAISLRYFNAAGCEPLFRVGECTETRIIPRLLRAARLGGGIAIFGNDYPTRDGTCVRDFVHVWDLAQAHQTAMQQLLQEPPGELAGFTAYNLGSGRGHTMMEVVRTDEHATKKF